MLEIYLKRDVYVSKGQLKLPSRRLGAEMVSGDGGQRLSVGSKTLLAGADAGDQGIRLTQRRLL